jgi:hypothetical protein
MKKVSSAIKGMEDVTTHEYAKKTKGEEADVVIVKMHSKMRQGPTEIEELRAGGKPLVCVGETDDGDTEELLEWRDLIRDNNEHRERRDTRRGGGQEKVNLNDAAKKGKVYAFGINERCTATTAARHVAMEVVKWRASTFCSKDEQLIPEDIGGVSMETCNV